MNIGFKKTKNNFLKATLLLVGLLLVINPVLAADGSGTNTVTPTSTTVSSTGGTYTFTYTATETMSSGQVRITVPSGWSTPQGTSGVAGYTTMSSTGTVGVVLDNADSLTGWNHNTSNPTACTGTLAIDTIIKHEGTGSVRCVNLADKNNGVWYHDITAQNWSAYTTVGFWIRVSSAINNGDLRFAYDNNNALASPIAALSLGSSIPANTWTYVSFPLTGTRTSVASFGFRIANLSSMGSTTVWADNFLLGASGTTLVPTFSGNTIILNAITLAAGQTITVTYGAGGGTSGVTAPSVSGVYTFTTETKTSDSGTLTNIASSPTVTVNPGAPGIPDMTAATDSGTSSTDNITNDTTPDFTISCNTGSTVTLFDNVTSIGSGTCAGGTVTITSSVLSSGVHASINAKQDGSVASGNLSITIDTTAPSAPLAAPDMTAGTDTGTSSTDNITSDNTPTFTGSCTTGETVNLYADGVQVGTTTCAGSAYTITSSALTPDGVFSMTTKFADTAGNLSASSPALSITIDTTEAAPGIPDMTAATDSGTSSTDNITSDTTPDFTISCVTGSIVTLFDNITSVGSGTCVGGTVAITASTLSSGTHATMNAKQTDAAGNVSVASGNLSITIDAAAPTLVEVTPVPTPTADNTPDYTFSSTEGGTITYGGDCSSPTTSASSGNNTITFNALTNGTYSNCTIRVTDVAGNISAILNVSSFTVNAVGPLDHFEFATISSPQTAGTAFDVTITAKDANNNTVTSFTGTVDLTTNTGTITPTTSGSFVSGVRTESVTMTPGSTLRTITATRTGGTETGTSGTFTLNNPVPTTTSISPDSKTVGDSTFTMTVNGTNFVSTSVVNFEGSPRTTTFISSVQVSASIPASDLLTAGTYNITVTNPAPVGGTSNAQTFTVNAPTATTTSISPSSKMVGSSGFTMTVRGTNFVTGSVAKFDGSTRVTNFISSTELEVTILSSDLTSAGSFLVVIENPSPGGGDSNAQIFTVSNLVPGITSISPSNKPVGAAQFTITIRGVNFLSDSVVKFGGSSKATTYVSGTELSAVIPASDLTTAGTFSITVLNPSTGEISNAESFTVGPLGRHEFNYSKTFQGSGSLR